MSSESDEVLSESTSKKIYHSLQETYMKDIANQPENVTQSELNLMVNQVLSLNGSIDEGEGSGLENLKTSLSDWQISQLEVVRESESGIRCLLNSWLVTQTDLTEGEQIDTSF